MKRKRYGEPWRTCCRFETIKVRGQRAEKPNKIPSPIASDVIDRISKDGQLRFNSSRLEKTKPNKAAWIWLRNQECDSFIKFRLISAQFRRLQRHHLSCFPASVQSSLIAFLFAIAGPVLISFYLVWAVTLAEKDNNLSSRIFSRLIKKNKNRDVNWLAFGCFFLSIASFCELWC